MRAASAAGMPEAGDVNILREAKRLLKKHDKGNPVETLDFPADPKELACFPVAYPEDDLPVLLDAVTVSTQKVSLRSTNADAVVKVKETRGKSPAAAGQACQPTPEMFACQMMNFMTMMRGFQPQGGGATIDMSAFQPPAKRQKALGNVSATDAKGPEPQQAKPKDTLALEDGTADPEPSASTVKPEAEQKGKPQPSGPQRSLLATPKVDQTPVDDDLGPEELQGMLAKKKPAANKPSSKKSGTTSKETETAMKKPAANKPSVIKKMAGGWTMERRFRSTGQVDVHYRAPDGSVYRTLTLARQNGFRD